MPTLRSMVPEPIRRHLRRWRRGLFSGNGATERGLTYDELVHLVFPDLHDPAVRQIVDAVAANADLSDPATIRRMIGAVDQQTVASPMTVRLGPEDVVYRDVEGMQLALDAADASVARQIEAEGGYEPHLRAAFERHCRQGMTVVDVGANIGFYTLFASRLVGPSGRVIAIEPNSENCRLLVTSVSANAAANVELLPVACDNRRGWVYLKSHVGSNAGLIPSNDVLAEPGTIVAAFPLDDLLEERADLIKIDVEGAEGRVLAGARRVLVRDRPIVTTELSYEMLERVSGVDPKDYLGWFLDQGYRLFLLDKATGEQVGYPTADALLADWGDPFRIEDLLLLPD